jgi:hypothetical protein
MIMTTRDAARDVLLCIQGFSPWAGADQLGQYPVGVGSNDLVDVAVKSDDFQKGYVILDYEPARHHDWRRGFTDIVAWRKSV